MNLVLYSTSCNSSEAAKSDSVGYTGDVAGAHIIEVDIESDFGNLANDEATRALQVGPAAPLLVVNIMAPANGEVLEPDPYLIRVQVRDEEDRFRRPTTCYTLC